MFDPADKRFHIGCDLRKLSNTETQSGVPDLSKLPTYWYETGPHVVLEEYMRLGNLLTGLGATRNYTILVKRESSGNPWHSLLEIFSMTMTIDILKISSQREGNMPLLANEVAPNCDSGRRARWAIL